MKRQEKCEQKRPAKSMSSQISQSPRSSICSSSCLKPKKTLVCNRTSIRMTMQSRFQAEKKLFTTTLPAEQTVNNQLWTYKMKLQAIKKLNPKLIYASRTNFNLNWMQNWKKNRDNNRSWYSIIQIQNQTYQSRSSARNKKFLKSQSPAPRSVRARCTVRSRLKTSLQLLNPTIHQPKRCRKRKWSQKS